MYNRLTTLNFSLSVSKKNSSYCDIIIVVVFLPWRASVGTACSALVRQTDSSCFYTGRLISSYFLNRLTVVIVFLQTDNCCFFWQVKNFCFYRQADSCSYTNWQLYVLRQTVDFTCWQLILDRSTTPWIYTSSLFLHRLTVLDFVLHLVFYTLSPLSFYSV